MYTFQSHLHTGTHKKKHILQHRVVLCTHKLIQGSTKSHCTQAASKSCQVTHKLIAPIRTAHKATSKSHCTQASLKSHQDTHTHTHTRFKIAPSHNADELIQTRTDAPIHPVRTRSFTGLANCLGTWEQSKCTEGCIPSGFLMAPRLSVKLDSVVPGIATVCTPVSHGLRQAFPCRGST